MMDLANGLAFVDEDCVIVRATDGIAICSDDCGDCYFIGHIVSTMPYHVEWDENDMPYSADELARAISENGASDWCFAPRPFDNYHIGENGAYHFVIEQKRFLALTSIAYRPVVRQGQRGDLLNDLMAER